MTSPHSIRLTRDQAAVINALSIEELMELSGCEIDTAAAVIELRWVWVPAWMKPVADELLAE